MRNKYRQNSRPRTDVNSTEAEATTALSAMYDNAHKRLFVKKRKICPLSGEAAPRIDYKDVTLLKRFISERGRMLPSRITSVSAIKQRELSIAIKRSRILALIPFAEK